MSTLKLRCDMCGKRNISLCSSEVLCSICKKKKQYKIEKDDFLALTLTAKEKSACSKYLKSVESKLKKRDWRKSRTKVDIYE